MSKKNKNKKIDSVIVGKSKVKDSSPIVTQGAKLSRELHIFEREMTAKQIEFIKLAMNKDTKCIICKGPAGTAKTYYAVYAALKLMSMKRISDILYLRSAVECSDDKIGFLPGEIEQKLSPYIQPLMDKLNELLPAGDIKLLQDERRIDNIPIGFLRGRSFNCEAVIVDEAQDMSFKDLNTTMTRIGEFSKVFILGDVEQIDIKNSGFNLIYNGFQKETDKANGIYTFEFTDKDCVRSAFCKYILQRIREIKDEMNSSN